jgi:GH35 family endo-1,4-beta-xylanase
MKHHCFLFALLVLCCIQAQAQLSSNKDKFLGNITTDWDNSMDYDGYVFSDYWNQVTPENATKWESVEGTRGTYNWWGADKAANYASQKGFPFKFHTLVWGSQFPGWLRNLSVEERYQAIVKWMDAVKQHYPNLQLIDVVNEAMEGHQGETYLVREALGGEGITGYDWIIRAFEMAAERWPDAILIYNDFNTFGANETEAFIQLVRTLRNAGAPIDAYGCQSHDVAGNNSDFVRQKMAQMHNALQMPMYITEYDVPDANDGNQNWNYQQQIPVMWEADYCAGITLWGWHYGKTWTQDGNSGLIRNKQERSAMKWLRDYMKTDKARQAKSPFPGMVKEASVYVKPAALTVSKGVPTTITVNARLKTKAISSVTLYVNGQPLQTLTQAPYAFTHTPAVVGEHALKAVVTATDGTTYERLSAINVIAGFIPQPGVVAEVDTRFTSISQVGSRPFAIVNEQDGKALYGSGEQNLGYDDFLTAFTAQSAGYYFRLESLKNDADVKVRNYYRLRLITPSGQEYSVFGKPGYLNSQAVDTGWCSFILGLTAGNGEDIKNGAVWDVQYVDGQGFTLRNIGTGLYLHDTLPAKYDDPAYFQFCTLRSTTGIQEVQSSTLKVQGSACYDLQGRKIEKSKSVNGQLPKGLYIINNKKVFIK